MQFRLRFALLSPLAALLACGGSSNSNISAGAAPVTGDYTITIAGGTAKASIFTGALTVTNTSVSGVFRYNNPGTVCVPATQDISFTGSIVNSTMTLTSSAFSSSVATLTIPLPFTTLTSGQQTANGTAVIAGGTCATASTTAQAQYIPPFSGTFNGTLTGPVSGASSLTISQFASNFDGQFPATVAISFTSVANSNCNFSISNAAPVAALISGTTLQSSTANGASYSATISASNATTPLAVNVLYTSTGPGTTACSGTYSGTFN